jgi:hypothetical protein
VPGSRQLPPRLVVLRLSISFNFSPYISSE